MFILIFTVVLLVIYLYLLGYVKGTYHYDKRMYKNLYISICSNTDDCGKLAEDYGEFLGLVKKFKEDHSIDIHTHYFLSYLYSKVHKQLSKYCPDILECNPIQFDDIKCDNNTLLDFQKYYYDNISQNQHENIEFHDIQKRNERFKYPCSINVYTDYDTHGYLFNVDNVIRDGKCVKEITNHIEHDQYILNDFS
jgi:hypothetical protein